jgi:hypothetical protein
MTALAAVGKDGTAQGMRMTAVMLRQLAGDEGDRTRRSSDAIPGGERTRARGSAWSVRFGDFSLDRQRGARAGWVRSKPVDRVGAMGPACDGNKVFRISKYTFHSTQNRI